MERFIPDDRVTMRERIFHYSISRNVLFREVGLYLGIMRGSKTRKTLLLEKIGTGAIRATTKLCLSGVFQRCLFFSQGWLKVQSRSQNYFQSRLLELYLHKREID